MRTRSLPRRELTPVHGRGKTGDHQLPCGLKSAFAVELFWSRFKLGLPEVCAGGIVGDQPPPLCPVGLAIAPKMSFVTWKISVINAPIALGDVTTPDDSKATLDDSKEPISLRICISVATKDICGVGIPADNVAGLIDICGADVPDDVMGGVNPGCWPLAGV